MDAGVDPESGLDQEFVEMMEKSWHALRAKRRTLARLAELHQESCRYAHREPEQRDQLEGTAESRTDRLQASSPGPRTPRWSGSAGLVEGGPGVNAMQAESDEVEEDTDDDDDHDFLFYKGKRLHQHLSQRFLIEQERDRRRSMQREASEKLAARNRYDHIQDMQKTLAQQLEHLEQDRLRAERRRAITSARRQASSPRSSKASASRDVLPRRSPRAAAPAGGSPRRPLAAPQLPKLGVHRASKDEPAAALQRDAPWQEVPPPPPDLEPGLPTSGVLARRPIMWSMGHTQEWVSAVAGPTEESRKGHAKDRTGVTRGRSPPRIVLPQLAGLESVEPVLAVAERNREYLECSRRHRLQEMGAIAVQVRRFRGICA